MNKTFASIKELSDYLFSVDSLIIVTHERPDGDAIGSAFALQKAFLNIDKEADIYFSDTLPERYSHLCNERTFILNSRVDAKYNCCIALDCGNYDRLALYNKNIKNELPLINIDHHPDNELFGSCNFVNPSACATAEIIYDILFSDKRWKLCRDLANFILIGIMLDTGGLRFDNTNANVLRKVASLVDCGADYIRIIKEMYFAKPLAMMLLETDSTLNHMKSEFDGKFVYIHLSEDLMNKYGIKYKETEGIIDNLRTIKGVYIAATIARLKDGYKISLRSNNAKYPVNDIAKGFSGGGHRLAAGCFIKSDQFTAVESQLLEKVRHLLET